MPAMRPLVIRALATIVLSATLAGCGSKNDESASKSAKPTAAQKASKAEAAAKAERSREDAHLANAVTVGKAGAAVSLRYDLSAKPIAGQPFEIELVLVSRVDADTLDVEAHGMPGLDVAVVGSAQFQPVAAGEKYQVKLLLQPMVDGIYYVGVNATLQTKVQSSARAYSVPVVVGEMPPAESPVPAATDEAPVAAAKPEETSGKQGK